MKYLEIIPDFLSMYGVLTTQNTSQIRQEMSSCVKYIVLTLIKYTDMVSHETNVEHLCNMK